VVARAVLEPRFAGIQAFLQQRDGIADVVRPIVDRRFAVGDVALVLHRIWGVGARAHAEQQRDRRQRLHGSKACGVARPWWQLPQVTGCAVAAVAAELREVLVIDLVEHGNHESAVCLRGFSSDA
jgi:hypothetical protein